MRVALVTGANGQDGSYLVEQLLADGYRVHAVVRRHDAVVPGDGHPERRLHVLDVTDAGAVARVVQLVEADWVDDLLHETVEVYHLAGQSHEALGHSSPEHTVRVNALGALHVLEACRATFTPASVRIFQAGSWVQLHGLSPYAAGKVAADRLAKLYREAYGLYVVSALSYNHESERRPEAFFTRKVTAGLVRVKLGLQEKLKLASLEGRRDWGYAPEYAAGYQLALQQEKPTDWLFRTGVQVPLKDWVDWTLQLLDLRWGHVEVEARRTDRPTDVQDRGRWQEQHPALPRVVWEAKTYGPALCELMVRHDLARLSGKQLDADWRSLCGTGEEL